MWRRLLVLTGIAALTAWLVRRGRQDRARSGVPDPSEELRRRLDEARRREEGGAEAAGPPEGAGAPSELDARRRAVHDRARAAAEEMHGSTE